VSTIIGGQRSGIVCWLVGRLDYWDLFRPAFKHYRLFLSTSGSAIISRLVSVLVKSLTSLVIKLGLHHSKKKERKKERRTGQVCRTNLTIILTISIAGLT